MSCTSPSPQFEPGYFAALQRWTEATARLREEISRLSSTPGASLRSMQDLLEELNAAQETLHFLQAAADGGPRDLNAS